MKHFGAPWTHPIENHRITHHMYTTNRTKDFGYYSSNTNSELDVALFLHLEPKLLKTIMAAMRLRHQDGLLSDHSSLSGLGTWGHLRSRRGIASGSCFMTP